jgi:hypothetical protein
MSSVKARLLLLSILPFLASPAGAQELTRRPNDGGGEVWKVTSAVAVAVSRDGYRENFRQDLANGFADVLRSSYFIDEFYHGRSGTRHLLSETVPSERAQNELFKDLAAQLAKIEDGRRCSEDISCGIVVEMKASPANPPKLSKPRVSISSKPMTFEIEKTHVAAPLKSPWSFLIQVSEAEAARSDLRDPTSEEIKGKEQPLSGRIWKVQTIAELEVSFTGEVNRVVESHGWARFGGAGSAGTTSVLYAPGGLSSTVFDKWRVSWVYKGTLESNLAIGAKPVEFSGVSTDIDGYSPEALQVLIP